MTDFTFYQLAIWRYFMLLLISRSGVLAGSFETKQLRFQIQVFLILTK